MATKSMIERIKRVQAAARRKTIEELEAFQVEAAKKKSKKNKSDSFDEGKGKKPTTTAKDKLKKQAPKLKGDKSDAKLDVKGPVGDPKKSPKKSKQQELDSATEKLKSLTSAIPKPKTKATSKAKLADTSSVERKAWRKAKLAELKFALNSPAPAGNPAVLDDKGEEVGAMPNTNGKATKEQRVPAFQLLQKAQKMLPALTQSLTQANDMLEDAVMGADLGKIKGALSFLLTKIQEVTKGEIIPLGATIRKVMMNLSPKQASSEKYASVTTTARGVAQIESELSRSRVLMRMASNAF